MTTHNTAISTLDMVRERFVVDCVDDCKVGPVVDCRVGHVVDCMVDHVIDSVVLDQTE